MASLVADQIRRLDAYLDRLPVLSEVSSEEASSASGENQQGFAVADAFSNPRLDELLSIVKSLSATNSSRPLLPVRNIRQLLVRSGIHKSDLDPTEVTVRSPYETEIEWLLVSKAAVQLHGAILNSFLDHIAPLSNHIWYWDEVLGSYAYSSLYTVQTSPWRFHAWSLDIFQRTLTRTHNSPPPTYFATIAHGFLPQRWGRFYSLVRDSIRERSFANIQRKVLSPVAFCRGEARRKQAAMKKLREVTACGLGVLMCEGLQFVQEDDKALVQDHSDLKGTVERSVVLMDMVLKEVCHVEQSVADFEEKIFAGVEQDPELSVHVEDIDGSINRPAVLGRRLLHIIDNILPQHAESIADITRRNGQPSPIVRYWLPAIVCTVSSTTILRLVVNHQADILDWIANLGATARDFWFNWVIEPSRKVLQTIRHDQSSEIAIMSRDSLKADRESLERMVVDFAVDNPRFADATGSTLTEDQIALIRSKVAEGDVTPVLKAFEKDLRKPLVGAVRGDLVRSLLIQVQKTKVDLEVAMTGIDALLKSQELVFGLVGLTPGVIMSIGFLQYFRGLFGGRSGQRRSTTAKQAVRVLRNIDRVLTEAPPVDNNMPSYTHHGLLLCEVQTLRSLASRLMPSEIEREFLEDLSDLSKLRGAQFQAQALSRIRWAYARWLR
ncbi:nuclear control of ATPase protein 2 [Geosmithia morbida]|uniref:Nuclear control of ATPase protein 2 n=1 Tax=Geosmithia morbida TaxID=1094350 RepID=A0A9P4Z1E8_9HYPO|nr:nuclear control of ATPase protein 2 [Geosmithia morbida]KAF4126810.1 nuclear control of ATPase protein 2 [Geosmithia morbida]